MNTCKRHNLSGTLPSQLPIAPISTKRVQIHLLGLNSRAIIIATPANTCWVLTLPVTVLTGFHGLTHFLFLYLQWLGEWAKIPSTPPIKEVGSKSSDLDWIWGGPGSVWPVEYGRRQAMPVSRTSLNTGSFHFPLLAQSLQEPWDPMKEVWPAQDGHTGEAISECSSGHSQLEPACQPCQPRYQTCEWDQLNNLWVTSIDTM